MINADGERRTIVDGRRGAENDFAGGGRESRRSTRACRESSPDEFARGIRRSRFGAASVGNGNIGLGSGPRGHRSRWRDPAPRARREGHARLASSTPARICMGSAGPFGLKHRLARHRAGLSTAADRLMRVDTAPSDENWRQQTFPGFARLVLGAVERCEVGPIPLRRARCAMRLHGCVAKRRALPLAHGRRVTPSRRQGRARGGRARPLRRRASPHGVPRLQPVALNRAARDGVRHDIGTGCK